MNIKLSFLVAADNIIVDSINLRPSYIGVFDFLTIPKNEESIFYTFHVGGKMNIDQPNDNLVTTIKIFDPKGDVACENSIVGSVGKGDVDFKIIFKLIKFSIVGKYMIILNTNGSNLDEGRFYFEVKKAK